MFRAHLAKGRQLDDCNTTSSYTDRAGAVAEGLSKAKGCSFVARPAICKDHLGQLVGAFSLRDVFTLLAVARWIFSLRKKSEAVPSRRRAPSEHLSEMGRAKSRGPGDCRVTPNAKTSPSQTRSLGGDPRALALP